MLFTYIVDRPSNRTLATSDTGQWTKLKAPWWFRYSEYTYFDGLIIVALL